MERGIVMVDLFNRQPAGLNVTCGAINLAQLGTPAEQAEFIAGATINPHGFAEVEMEYDPANQVDPSDLPEGVRFEPTVLKL